MSAAVQPPATTWAELAELRSKQIVEKCFFCLQKKFLCQNFYNSVAMKDNINEYKKNTSRFCVKFGF
jgi:hypothetical protein